MFVFVLRKCAVVVVCMLLHATVCLWHHATRQVSDIVVCVLFVFSVLLSVYVFFYVLLCDGVASSRKQTRLLFLFFVFCLVFFFLFVFLCFL